MNTELEHLDNCDHTDEYVVEYVATNFDTGETRLVSYIACRKCGQTLRRH